MSKRRVATRDLADWYGAPRMSHKCRRREGRVSGSALHLHVLPTCLGVAHGRLELLHVLLQKRQVRGVDDGGVAAAARQNCGRAVLGAAPYNVCNGRLEFLQRRRREVLLQPLRRHHVFRQGGFHIRAHKPAAPAQPVVLLGPLTEPHTPLLCLPCLPFRRAIPSAFAVLRVGPKTATAPFTILCVALPIRNAAFAFLYVALPPSTNAFTGLCVTLVPGTKAFVVLCVALPARRSWTRAPCRHAASTRVLVICGAQGRIPNTLRYTCQTREFRILRGISPRPNCTTGIMAAFTAPAV
jgi:hypothetical protein